MQVAIPFWRGGSAATSGLTAYVSAQNADGYAFYDGSPPAPIIYTDEITVTAYNGTAPYTYQWTEVDNSSEGYTYPSGIDIANPTSASTRFREQDATGAYSKIGFFKCTVTDAAAATADTAWVEVLIEQTT